MQQFMRFKARASALVSTPFLTENVSEWCSEHPSLGKDSESMVW